MGEDKRTSRPVSSERTSLSREGISEKMSLLSQFACVSTKSLPLDQSGHPPDESSTDPPRTPSHEPINPKIPYDPVLRVRSEPFHTSDLLVDGVLGGFLLDRQHSPQCEGCSRNEPALDMAGPTVSNIQHDLDHSAGSTSSDQLRLGHSGPYSHSVPTKGILWIRKQGIMKYFILSTHRADHLNNRETTQPLVQDQRSGSAG
jgi:hypothetical protein